MCLIHNWGAIQRDAVRTWTNKRGTTLWQFYDKQVCMKCGKRNKNRYHGPHHKEDGMGAIFSDVSNNDMDSAVDKAYVLAAQPHKPRGQELIEDALEGQGFKGQFAEYPGGRMAGFYILSEGRRIGELSAKDGTLRIDEQFIVSGRTVAKEVGRLVGASLKVEATTQTS